MSANAPPRLRSLVSLGLCLSWAGLATAQEWRRAPAPSPRTLHAAVFDPARGVTVMFGGSGNSGLLDDTWEYDGDRWTNVTMAVRPSARQGHAMTYDQGRGVILLFGGHTGGSGPVNDTWEYDGTAWTQVATSGAPTPRSQHAMSYDATLGVHVMFGGSSVGYIGETWEYDGATATWTQVSPPASPSSRAYHAMAFDAARQVHVVFGGVGGSGYASDTWEYAAATSTWTQSPATGPSARYGVGMTFDGGVGKVALCGGLQSGSLYANDTWHYDGIAWVQPPLAASPPLRRSPTMVYDDARGCLVLHGGFGPGGRADDTWECDNTTWTLRLDPILPPGRLGPGLVYDGLHRKVVMFGGLQWSSGWNSVADTWEYDGATWAQVTTPSAPPPRSWFGLSYDAARGRVVLYGGGRAVYGNWSNLFDTWEYDGQTWVQVPTTANPAGSIVQAMAYDARRGRHVVYGGIHTTGGNNWVGNDETWEYDGQDWTRVLTATTPGLRNGHGLAYDARRGRVVLFGGVWGGPKNDTWEYDGAAWSQVLTNSAPSARIVGGTMTYDPARGRVMIVGGLGGSPSQWVLLNDTWDYDGSAWRMIQPAGSPPLYESPGSTFDVARNRIVRFGGRTTGTSLSNETWEYVPEAQPAWTGYGVGCSGSVGTPFLSMATPPILGTNLTLLCSGLPLTSGVLYTAVGFDLGRFGSQPLPLELSAFGLAGCRLWVAPDPAMSFGQLHTGVSETISIPIPGDPAFAGIRFGTQVLVLDLASPNGIGALSNAGIATIH